MYYYLTFDIVCDEIESRVFTAINDLSDYTVYDMIPQLVNQFCLDYPEEARHYRREVIESVFEMKTEIALGGIASEPEPDYLKLEAEYFGEPVQLSLF